MTALPHPEDSLPRRAWKHGFPLVRLSLGVKATHERGWPAADPPLDGWDLSVNRPGICGWIEQGGNVGVRSGAAPRIAAVHPGLAYSDLIDLDMGHWSDPCICGYPASHQEILERYFELVEFCRARALLLVRSVSGDDGYGALFAGSEPLATASDLFDTRIAHGVDLVAFYGVGSGGGGSQKVIPPSRIHPDLLDTDEQRARLKRTEYEVVVDALDDADRWAGQTEAIAWLARKLDLRTPGVRRSAPLTQVSRSQVTSDEAEALRRLGRARFGRAHVAVVQRLRELGHHHGQGHAETRWALSCALTNLGIERELTLDLLGYPRGSKCRERHGRDLVESPGIPFGEGRLRKVPIYSELPEELFAGPTALERRIRRFAGLPWRDVRDVLGEDR